MTFATGGVPHSGPQQVQNSRSIALSFFADNMIVYVGYLKEFTKTDKKRPKNINLKQMSESNKDTGYVFNMKTTGFLHTSNEN